VIFVIENSNKFQKTRFWKEKSIENLVKLASLSFNSIMGDWEMISYLGQWHLPH
jgi:hypothetical protein